VLAQYFATTDLIKPAILSIFTLQSQSAVSVLTQVSAALIKTNDYLNLLTNLHQYP
jgi:hypothetical protein